MKRAVCAHCQRDGQEPHGLESFPHLTRGLVLVNTQSYCCGACAIIINCAWSTKAATLSRADKSPAAPIKDIYTDAVDLSLDPSDLDPGPEYA